MDPKILSVEKIWDEGTHNAFTDLVRYAGKWWCTFREAADHGWSIGTVRVICSEDGQAWASAAVLAEDEVDLRDPKLAVMPDGRLMLVMGGALYEGTEYRTRSPRIGAITGRISGEIRWPDPSVAALVRCIFARTHCGAGGGV